MNKLPGVYKNYLIKTKKSNWEEINKNLYELTTNLVANMEENDVDEIDYPIDIDSGKNVYKMQISIKKNDS